MFGGTFGCAQKGGGSVSQVTPNKNLAKRQLYKKKTPGNLFQLGTGRICVKKIMECDVTPGKGCDQEETDDGIVKFTITEVMEKEVVCLPENGEDKEAVDPLALEPCVPPEMTVRRATPQRMGKFFTPRGKKPKNAFLLLHKDFIDFSSCSIFSNCTSGCASGKFIYGQNLI